MTKRLLLGAVVALLLAASAAAQSFPVTVKLGVDPDASGNTLGYTVQLDAGAVQDIGLPAVNPSCVAFVGGATSPCVPFSVSVPNAGAHTVKVVAYNLLGSSAPATLSLPVPTGVPSTPGGVKVIK